MIHCGMGVLRLRSWTVRLGLCLVMSCGLAPWAQAQVSAALTHNPTWQELGARNQHILAPLSAHWDQMGVGQKQKWLSLAGHYPRLDPEQQQRAQDRMADWARMSPEQRQNARLNFFQAQDVPRSERQARWEAYQALPEDTKKELARQWAARRAPLPDAPYADAQASARDSAALALPGQPAASRGAPPRRSKVKAVGPGTVQAPVGATTRPLTEKPRPPSYPSVNGLRITFGPDWIDPMTLLPRRGPQAAGAPLPALRTRPTP